MTNSDVPSVHDVPGRAPLLDRIVALTQQQPGYTIAEKLTLAEHLGKSGVFPSIQTVHQAFAAIEIGEALGMKPGIALMSIDFGAQGKPSINVHWQAGRMQELGWRWEFLTHTSDTCQMRFLPPPGRGEPFTYAFSMSEAKAVLVHDREQGKSGGSGGGRATLGEKWNYKSWAADMLYAFVMRRIVRRYEPRILSGYAGTEEEETAQALDVGAYEGEKPTAAQAQLNIADLWGGTVLPVPAPHPTVVPLIPDSRAGEADIRQLWRTPKATHRAGEADIRQLWRTLKATHVPPEVFRAWLRENLGVETTTTLLLAQVHAICDLAASEGAAGFAIDTPPPPAPTWGARALDEETLRLPAQEDDAGVEHAEDILLPIQEQAL